VRTIEELEAENAQLVAFVKAVGGIWTDTVKSKLDGEEGLASAINRDSRIAEGITQPALETYSKLGCAEEEPDPVERLRFFCSLAFKNPQDWLDVEPFFDALANPSDKQEADGVAVTASGAEYHNPRKAYAEAEEAGCVRMWLDDLGAPIGDDAGTFSLVGRIHAHFSNPSDKQDAVARVQSYESARPYSKGRRVMEVVFLRDVPDDTLLYAAPLAQSAEKNYKEVGTTGTMPGTDGFTMAAFAASDVPVGTTLYIEKK
jgi:hypothetical protein